jgi:hypothetical protein
VSRERVLSRERILSGGDPSGLGGEAAGAATV